MTPEGVTVKLGCSAQSVKAQSSGADHDE
jgi:hypothetical protein